MAAKFFFKIRDITTLPAHQRTRLGIARSFQIPKPFNSMTVLENLCIPLVYAAPLRPTGLTWPPRRWRSSNALG